MLNSVFNENASKKSLKKQTIKGMGMMVRVRADVFSKVRTTRCLNVVKYNKKNYMGQGCFGVTNLFFTHTSEDP